jgi:hypothetical protein
MWLVLEKIIENPVTPYVVAFVLGSPALTGKPSVRGAQMLLIAAWVTAVFGMRELPLSMILWASGILGMLLILLAHHFRPETIPAHTAAMPSETQSPAEINAQFSAAIDVSKMWLQMPDIAVGIIHINIEFFNGNNEDIYLKGINGNIVVTRLKPNDKATQLGKLPITPKLYETRRNHIPARDRFSIIIAQEVPKKFADELSNWDEAIKYVFNFESLDIIVESTCDPIKSRRLPLWDAAEIQKKNGVITAYEQIIMRPGKPLRGLTPYRSV